MNTIKFLLSFEKEENQSICTKFNKIRTELYSKGVCWTDSVNGNFSENDHFRVILYLKKNTNDIDFRNPIITECNGLVLSYTNNTNAFKWAVLVSPPANCTKSKVSMIQVDKIYKARKYQIYEILDATIISMYYYNDKWCIATNKGFDVSDLEFINGQTYMQVFEKIAKDMYYPRFTFDQYQKQSNNYVMDTKYGYTFALRFADFHKFNETKHINNQRHLQKNTRWSSNSSDRSDLQKSTQPVPAISDSNTYLKLMRVVHLESMKEVDIKYVNIGIPIYLPIKVSNAYSVSVLLNYTKNAYMKYVKGYETNNFKFKPLYGYILRSTSNDIHKQYKNIIISSSLFSTIKKGLYTNTKLDNQQMITNMFVDQPRKQQYKILFDEYLLQFNKLETIVNNICNNVFELIQTGYHLNDNPYVQQLSNKVLQQYQQENNNLNDSESTQKVSKETTMTLLYDYIHSKDYMNDLNLIVSN